MARRVTVKDLANLLGISHSTVARALSGNSRVHPETRAKVLAAATEHGYVANSGARILRAGTSTLVGLVIPDVQNEVNALLAKSIGDYCVASGHQMVLSNSDEDPEVALSNIRALAEIRCAGAVIMPTMSPRREALRLLKEFPTVQILRHHSSLGADWVGVDDHEAMALATRHLVELGHSRIAYIGGVIEMNTGAGRLAGYRDVLAESGIEFDEELVSTGSVRASFAREVLERLFRTKQRPTALISAGARVTVGILDGIEAMGLRVPEDLSLVAYTDPPWLRGWGPGITAVSAPFREVGAAAGALLMQRISEEAVRRDGKFSPVSSVFRPTLEVRGSTCRPRN